MAEECSNNFREDSSLADYINYWLWNADGAADCFGTFEIFLKVIPLIVDEWYRDPTILYFGGYPKEDIPPIEHRATSAFGGDSESHAIFDRDNFIAAVYTWQHSNGRS
jgi:hypothetical protein